MACPAIITGDQFVTRVLTHIDCQTQYLGSYGYQSLSEPGSPASIAVTGLLTLFVALWGVRLLFGPGPSARDLVHAALKVGIVLTLAFSWPAFRTLIFDVVLDGPAEIAASISTPGLVGTGSGLVERLQAADNAIVALTESGTGRRSGQFVDDQVAGGTFEGTALEDQSSFGLARLTYLAGLFSSLGLLRLLAGFLLAIAPLAAGLLLFEATRGLFAGWLKGLVLAIVGAAAITLVLAVELAMLESWLADALRLRQLGYATPSAPTELLAMLIGFAIIKLGLIALLARVAFGTIQLRQDAREMSQYRSVPSFAPMNTGSCEPVVAERAARLSDFVERRLRIEENAGASRLARTNWQAASARGAEPGQMLVPAYAEGRLGSSHRRSRRDPSRSSARRDAGS